MQFEVLKSFAREGPLSVIVSGDCMQQTIPEGSRLNLEHRRFYWPGDVIAFKRGDDAIVCHRCLGYFPTRNGWRVLTQAENSDRADAPVFVRFILGKVTQVEETPFSTGIKQRARALLQYFPAIAQQLLARFNKKEKQDHD